jgi:tRNA (cmo5U34)-methyltransferase
MMKDKIFARSGKPPTDFEFNAEVADVFDDMLKRSVPFYLEQQMMIRNIAKRAWISGTRLYDLGCSTGTTMIGLCRELPASARLVGYDNSPAMLERAKENIRAHSFQNRIVLRNADLNGPLSHFPLTRAGVVTMCWTLQFLRPLRRDNVIRWIYDGLIDEGMLIVTEKILTNSGHTNRFFIDLYYDFKRLQGYSNTEIMRKREALENVLIPYRLDENFDLFRRNGFEMVETFFQWFNFAGFLCVKKPALASRRLADGARISKKRPVQNPG